MVVWWKQQVSTEGKYVLDPLSLVILIAQVLIGGSLAVKYASTDMYISVAQLIYLSFTGVSLGMFAAFNGGLKFDTSFNIARDWLRLLLIVVLGVISIAAAQAAIAYSLPLIIAASTLDRKLFYLVAGASEEMWFRYFVQTRVELSLGALKIPFWMMYPLTWAAVTSLFVAYHFTVYGALLQGLLAVMAGSIVLSIVYSHTKRVSICQAIHMWVNFLAA